WKIIKGLNFTTQLGARAISNNGKEFVTSYEIRDRVNPTIVRKARPINTLQETRNSSKELTLNSFLNYSTSLDKHTLAGLAGYSEIQNSGGSLTAFRQGFYNNDIQAIGQGTNDATKSNGGGETNWGLRSFFGRVNYAFDDKYLFEANARYDGSSRFSDNNRYSFFPSFSAGWRLSEEKFWGGLSNYVNEFKLRGSWGKTGNQAVDLYSYYSTLNLVTYSFNGAPVQGYTQQQLSSKDLTWETTTQSNIGLDAQFLNNRLSLGVDYYEKRTDGILLMLPVPATLGLLASPQNAGIVDNKGWEFAAGTRNKFGNFGLNVNLNFNINDNNVVDLAGTGPYITGSDIDPRYLTGEGYPIDSFWGYRTDGFFQTKADADKSPVFIRPALAGDIKYVDMNNDKVIDAKDMTFVGNPFPKYTFGSSWNLAYKGFNLNMLLQGASGHEVQLTRALVQSGTAEAFTHKIYTNNFWSPENPNARFPRPIKFETRNQVNSDFNTIDGDYIRLKNIQLQYQIPTALTKRLLVERMNVYVSGTNLLTFSKLNEWNLDPEKVSGWENYYPQVSLYTLGFNLQF
ncbi:SusC/RagA family TonB-linked outer membrane protein, partial [Daejeonella sp.]|uniref:SusC/RagA family TonB-linked outer membrane protein n=1 Tax=Daejeonella sp. TaxID=2805397 RepID=UPI0030BDE98B